MKKKICKSITQCCFLWSCWTIVMVTCQEFLSNDSEFSELFFFSTILISLQSLNDPSDNCVGLESWAVSVKLDTNTMGIEMIFNSSFNMCK